MSAASHIGIPAYPQYPLDLVFVLDSSGSIGDVNWEKIKIFCKALVDKLEIGPNATQLSIVTFNLYSTVRFYLHNCTDKSCTAINKMPNDHGENNVDIALHEVWSGVFVPGNGSRLNAQRMAIVITDSRGKSDDHGDTILNATQCTVQYNITLIAIGVTNQIDLE